MSGRQAVAGGTLAGVVTRERGRAGAAPADSVAGALPRRPSMRFRRPVPVLAAVTVAGPVEQAGPLGGRFDRRLRDHLGGQRTWEKAEARFQEVAVEMAAAAAGLRPEDIDAVLGGDLQSQLGATSFAGRTIDLPLLGLYGACASCGEGLLLGAALCDAGLCRHVVVVVSSHHDAAERQFRFPTEFGTQRPPTAQWTATGAAAFVLGFGDGADGAAAEPDPEGDGDPADRPQRDRDGRDGHREGRGRGGGGRTGSGGGHIDGGQNGTAPRDARGDSAAASRRPCIVAATPGRVVDMGVKDPYDMGGAEAPAAADTIARHLRNRGLAADAYAAIATGDLARYGRPVCEDLLREEGFAVRLSDCGERLYDPTRQDVHAGGSGAACCGLVLAADLLPRVRAGEWRRLLFVATGALLSPTSYQQGESIPCIAHAVEIAAPGEAERP